VRVIIFFFAEMREENVCVLLIFAELREDKKF